MNHDIGKPRAILFDLDDTLCDTSASRFDRASLVAQLLVSYAAPLLINDIVAQLLEPVAEMGWPRGARPLVADLGLSESAIGRQAIGLWYFQGCEALLHRNPGVEDAIALLSHDFRLGIVTNGDDDIQRHKFELLGLSDYFGGFISSGAAGHQKPEPEIFQVALEALEVQPQETLFIGDHLHSDIRGAQLAGLRSIWFNPEGHSTEDGIVPDGTIRGFSELSGLLGIL